MSQTAGYAWMARTAVGHCGVRFRAFDSKLETKACSPIGLGGT